MYSFFNCWSVFEFCVIYVVQSKTKKYEIYIIWTNEYNITKLYFSLNSHTLCIRTYVCECKCGQVVNEFVDHKADWHVSLSKIYDRLVRFTGGSTRWYPVLVRCSGRHCQLGCFWMMFRSSYSCLWAIDFTFGMENSRLTIKKKMNEIT